MAVQPGRLLPVLCSLAFSSFPGQAASFLSVFRALRTRCLGTFLSTAALLVGTELLCRFGKQNQVPLFCGPRILSTSTPMCLCHHDFRKAFSPLACELTFQPNAHVVSMRQLLNEMVDCWSLCVSLRRRHICFSLHALQGGSG